MKPNDPRSAKPCAACVHSVHNAPAMCGRFLTAWGRPRMGAAVRLSGEPCGPQAAFFEAAEVGPAPEATVLKFAPLPNVRSFS